MELDVTFNENQLLMSAACSLEENLVSNDDGCNIQYNERIAAVDIIKIIDR